MKKTIISYLSTSEFQKMLSLLSSVNIDITEQYGICVRIKDTNYIFISNDPSLSDQDKQIILWHEKGHALGIDSEEEADRYALKHLSKKAQDYLISIWTDRHGHPYR
jgi:hypothetical protein